MELKEYILMELEGVKRSLGRVTGSLKQNEITWRPSCGCNSIGLILFHMIKSEDSFIQARLRGKPELFESEKWYQKLNLAVDESGAHYSIDQVNSFPVPELKDLMAYAEAVYNSTVAHLKGMQPADFDKKITMPFFGEMPAAAIFNILVSHAAQHIGEISYLRGLQRGMDK